MPANPKRTWRSSAQKANRDSREGRVPRSTRDSLVPSRPGPPTELAVIPKKAGDEGGSVKAPPSKPSIKLVVVGPTTGGRANSIENSTLLDLLELVKQRHNVEIESGVPFANALTVSSSSRQSLSAALRDINLARQRVDVKGHKPLFSVHASATQQKTIRQSAQAGYPGWTRFTCDAASDAASDPEALDDVVADFGSKIAELAPVIRVVPSNISLQIHLGKMITSTDDRLGPASVTSAAHLGGIVNGTNTDTGVSFDRSIGDGDFFNVCRKAAARAADHFLPTSAVIDSLDEVPLERSLIIITAAFRIELEISPPKINSRVARLSCPRVAQLVGAEGRTDLTVLCPDHHMDWKLETFPELKVDDIPSSIKSMMADISISYTDREEDFPMPIIPASVLSAHRIKLVYGKVSLTATCRGNKLMLEQELCRIHKFPQGEGKSQGYKVSTCISIKSPVWAEVLKAPAAAGVVRNLDASWSQVFKPRRKRSGLSELLHSVQHVLAFWDGVLGAHGASMTDSSVESATENNSQAPAVQSTTGLDGQILPDEPQPVLDDPEDDLISFD